MKTILPGLYTFTGLLVGRAYLIEEPDGYTLIDTSRPGVEGQMAHQMKAKGFKIEDIKRILITHTHYDHVGSLPALKAMTGAEVICSSVEKPYVQGELPPPVPDRDSLRPMARMMASTQSAVAGTPVDRTVEDGDVLDNILGEIQVIFTPGHSPGHVAYWQPNRRILFCGDVAMHGMGTLTRPFAAYTPDMAEDMRSLLKLGKLRPKLVLFGHGGPLQGEDAGEKLEALARRHGAS